MKNDMVNDIINNNNINKSDTMDYKLLIDTAALAGTLMLKHGAEIYRVEETINYMLSISNLKTTVAFVMSTGLFISLDDPSIDALTVVRRVNSCDTNLDMVAKVNSISRNLYNGTISLEDAFYMLKHLDDKLYPWWLKDISILMVVVFFTGMFGGTALDMTFNLIVGICLAAWLHLGSFIRLNPLITDLLSSVIISSAASILVRNINGLHLNLIIIGAIMLLVPGAAITNAIRDTLHGDYAAGSARILEAFVKAALIALGVYIGFIITGTMKI